MNECKASEYIPKNAGEILDWARENGIIPVPCQPKSKAPMGIISRKGVYKNNPPDKRELLRNYDRRYFGKSVRDSFHIPSPERLAAIRNFWDISNTAAMDIKNLSISLDMNYPTEDGFTIACIDIDRDDCITLADEKIFSGCPLISGKKGGKLFFKLNRQKSLPSPIIQYSTADNLNLPGPEQKPASVEIFTGHKHALIYGEHPESTTEKPIQYYFLRGFGCRVPVITWQETTQCLKKYADKNGLVIRKTSEVIPYDQTNLSEWGD
jgi:hypothetical protein